MWDSGRTATRVIDHGIAIPPDVGYTGELRRGIVVVNDLAMRGRRLGADLFLHAAKRIPLDLVGMSAERLGGIGEIPRSRLPEFEARYRFFFNPIRYTSLGLAIVEAMMVGLPIIGLATTELVTVIRNGENGFIDTDVDALVDCMKELLADAALARRLGEAARASALERFGIDRFVADWQDALARVTQ
jgi:glycosyltransferase involved in cell wall biosynthesis